MVDEEHDSRQKPAATREILEDLKEWSGKVFQKVREEADTISARGKLTIDLTSLKSRRRSEFRKLGEKIYELLEDGTYEIPEAAPLLGRIRDLMEEIEARESRLQEIGQKSRKEASGEEKEEPVEE